MARLKIEVPEKSIAVLKIPVRISDINYGNHVGNDAFVSILHEARMQWLAGHGYTELNIEGTGLIMSDLQIEFKKESFYGDTIEVKLGVDSISRVSFELFYQLYAHRNGETILLAVAKTGMVSYDYAAGKVSPLPDGLKRILE